MPENYLHAAIEIAQEAGKVLVEELPRPLDIAYKGDEVDLVTQADKRSERLIVERLTKYFPEHAIAAEEGTGHESASASRSRSPGGIRFSPPWSSIRFTRNFSPPRAAKAPPSTARKSKFPKMPPSRQACCAPGFPCATASSAPIFNTTATSPSAPTACGVTGPPRWT